MEIGHIDHEEDELTIENAIRGDQVNIAIKYRSQSDARDPGSLEQLAENVDGLMDDERLTIFLC